MLNFIDLNFSVNETGICANLVVSGVTVFVEMPTLEEGGYPGKWTVSTYRGDDPAYFEALDGRNKKDLLNNLEVNYILQKIQEELGY